MPESSFLDKVKERVREVSQSGLTHEVEVGLEFGLGSLLVEALMEKEWNGLVGFGEEGEGRRVSDEKEWREQSMVTGSVSDE